MPGFGHAERAEQFEVDEVGDVALVVACGAQVLHRTAEQAPLDARLHHERRVRVTQHLDADDRPADVAGTTVLGAEARRRKVLRGQLLHLGEDLRPRGTQVERGIGEVGTVQCDAQLVADVLPPAVQRGAQAVDGGGVGDLVGCRRIDFGSHGFYRIRFARLWAAQSHRASSMPRRSGDRRWVVESVQGCELA